jgi:hypothetical protein
MGSCPRCSAEVAVDDRFCRSCGAPQPVVDASDTTGHVEVVGDSGPLPVIDTDSIEALGPGAAVLVVRRGPNEGARFVLSSGTLSAGRSPDSAIFLDDVTVSRRHATFTSDGQGWSVTDAGSLNGTYVNKARIDDSTRLATGDEVQVGKYRFVFVSANEGGEAS